MTAKKDPTEIKRRGHNLTHLREWLLIQAVQQKDLAARTGLTRHTLGKLESGINYARNDTLNRIAAALGLPADVLLSDPDDLSLEELKKYNPVMYRRVVSQLQRQAVTGEAHRETFTA